MTDTAAKLPEIEHVKSRKNGLDVLADIYRYAELGFAAIEPDDLALFRWYGVYTQRAEANAAAGEPGPSEDTDGLFMLRVKFPNGIVTADQMRTIGELAERYGRGMGDITTRQNIQLHNLAIEDIPVVLDELNAVGLSFTQACGDVWRNIVGCPLTGVDGHELIDSRPLIAGARAGVRRQARVLEPAPQVQGLGVGVRARLRPARDQRHRAGRRREGRRDRLRRLGRRRARRFRQDGPAAGRVRVARGGGRGLPRRSPRSSATRAAATSAPARGSSSWSTSGAWSASAPSSRQASGPRAADLGRAGRAARPASRPPRHPPAGAARPLLRRRHHAARPVHRRPDDRRRRHRHPLRLGAAPLHQPPEHHRRGRPRRSTSTRWPPSWPTSGCQPRRRRSGAASSRAPAWSSASWRSSRPSSAPPS